MSARILIVDDNPLNLKLLAAKLARDYYIVQTAENGAAALELIKQRQPDIVLLDVMMPEMDGFEACRKIKGDPATSAIPVVMVTALSDVADRVKGLEAGADDFLTKPINDLALMARVRSLLRFKMVMDEWRLREITAGQFMETPPGEHAALAALSGGHVLLLEDNAFERQNIAQSLSSAAIRITFAGTVGEAAQLAHEGDFDLVFASLDLKNEDGLQICPQLRTHEATRQLPILLISNESEMTRVSKGLDLGANDYLLRPVDANELIARTRTQMRHKRHYDRLRQNYENSLSLALVDPLTGAFNRRYLDAHLPKLMARSNYMVKPLSTLMIDIDYFKKVNDTYGHDTGDIVLKTVASNIMNSLRPSDLVVRYGGEEFAVIMPETELPAALSIAERVRQRIEKLSIGIHNDGEKISATVSIGAATLAESEELTVPDLIKRADEALYKAKEEGRNCVKSYV